MPSSISPPQVERKLVLERLCLAVDFVHSKNLVLVDLKPQNVVIFGSLLGLKVIDLECVRKAGEPIPFKLTPYYAAPELAAAALETMRLGQLPSLEYRRRPPDGGADGGAGDGAGDGAGEAPPGQWGPNLQRLSLLEENPTLARAVAAASHAANRAGAGSSTLNRDDLKQLEAPLKLPNGKPLRAQPPMDVWALGMLAYELFVNEPFFAGCSDDVALQALASQQPLELPSSRIAEPQAEHLLAKILQKRAKERITIEQVLRHAYLVGGLDTQQVSGSFAMLHESQQTFKGELDKLTGRMDRGMGGRSQSRGGSSGQTSGAASRGQSFKQPPAQQLPPPSQANFSSKRATFSEAAGAAADGRTAFAKGSVLGTAMEGEGTM